MAVMISTTHLYKQYGGLVAVNDVSVNVEQGAIVGLVGKNGAGKTTLIRILTGLVKPTGGQFALLPNQERKNTDVAAIVERPSIYLNMTAMDNMIAQSKLLGMDIDREYLVKTIELVGLDANSKMLAKKFSLGMKQRLAIAMTLVGKPKLLILDEPTNGLDPQGMHDMRELFVKLNKQYGTTLVISTHILSELSKVATEYLFMDKGKVVRRLTADELDKLGQKRVRITVDDVNKAAELLAAFGEAKIVSENAVELYGETPPTQILLALAQNGVTASNITNVGGDLEEYFIDALKNGKGGAHD